MVRDDVRACRKNILVVDDDEGIIETMRDILQERGNDVDTANSGMKAIDLVTVKKYDVVFMDVKMVGMNGIATYKKMKAMNLDINVVFVTAYLSGATSIEIEKEGRVVLYKPVDMRKLASIIDASNRATIA